MASVSKVGFRVGWVITGLVGAFLMLDGIMKLFKPPFVVEANLGLGYSETAILPIGLVLIVCTVLYLMPATSILGAILLTGYLGGAVATHVRVGGPAFPIVFAVIIGVLAWGGLYLREPLLKRLIPFLASGDE